MKVTAAYKGLCIGILMIIAALISYLVLKLPVNQKEQYVLYIIFTLGTMWSLFAEKNNTSVITFKDYFEIGFRTFLIATLILVVFTFIFFKIDTSFRDNLILENNSLLVAEAKRTPIEIEENAKNIKKMFLPSLLISATFRFLILGALISAIGAGFLSKKNN